MECMSRAFARGPDSALRPNIVKHRGYYLELAKIVCLIARPS